MIRLSAAEINENTHRLFAPLGYNLAVGSILAGRTPGRVYVDEVLEPQIGLAWFKHRVFLAGVPGGEKQALALTDVFRDVLLAEAERSGQEAFVLHTHVEAWGEHLPTILPGLEPIQALREHYTCSGLQGDWRSVLPDSFTLRTVEAALMSETDLRGLDGLRDEMVSERPSIEDFLLQSFGICLSYADELVGWCLSEYNLDGRCEVGVATAEAYQRRGLGTAMSLALIEIALRRGYHEIGWHCWKRNIPSGALARKAGFTLESEYPVFLFLLKE